jgi:hypothetical protein
MIWPTLTIMDLYTEVTVTFVSDGRKRTITGITGLRDDGRYIKWHEDKPITNGLPVIRKGSPRA